MKVVVYGGNGMVGSRIVAEAVSRGHDVTSVSRSGAQVEGATSAIGELSDTAGLAAAAKGADVVVLSVPPDRTGGPAEPTITAHRDLIAAAPEGRFIVVGGAGSLRVGDDYLKDSAGFPAEYKPEATAFTTILEAYRQAPEALDWTLVSPSPLIAPGKRTGNIVLGTDAPAGDQVSAEDFAVGIVDEIENPKHRRSRFTIASVS